MNGFFGFVTGDDAAMTLQHANGEGFDFEPETYDQRNSCFPMPWFVWMMGNLRVIAGCVAGAPIGMTAHAWAALGERGLRPEVNIHPQTGIQPWVTHRRDDRPVVSAASNHGMNRRYGVLFHQWSVSFRGYPPGGEVVYEWDRRQKARHGPVFPSLTPNPSPITAYSEIRSRSETPVDR